MVHLLQRLRAAACVTTLLILAACAGPPARDEPPAGVSAIEDEAEKLLAQGDREGAANLYWEQARQAQSPRREDLQLRAVEAVLTLKTLPLARRYLGLLAPQDLRGPLLVRARIAEARLALLEKQPNAALAALPPGISLATPQYETQVEDLRAQALLASGRVFESIRVRSALGAKLNEPRAIERNRQQLWRAIGRASEQEVAAWAQEADDYVLRGWLELGYIAKISSSDLKDFDRQLETWRERYAGHPAGKGIIDTLRAEWKELQVRPRQIAIMLPMSGTYAPISEAVMAGFMAAYYTDDEVTDKPSIRTYDLGDGSADVWDTYLRAVENGADFVVGPLDKEGVAILAGRRKLPVPVLSLNYADEVEAPPRNLYEFGLLPEDEARQVAERASLAGHQTALALAPEGEWGQRLLDAFRARFQQLGGTVLDAARYDATATDYADTIKDVLGIDSSEQRNQELRALLKRDLEFEPRPRPDADMMFMVALPSQARLLRPQLRFHYASELPVYATSHIYTAIEDVTADRDIDGVIYCDMPWTLEGANPYPALRARLDRMFPQESRQLPRLMALGFDAYRIIYYLKRLAERPYERYAGLTGDLHMDDLGRIHRELKWGRFVDGRPSVLNELVTQSGLDAITSAR